MFSFWLSPSDPAGIEWSQIELTKLFGPTSSRSSARIRTWTSRCHRRFWRPGLRRRRLASCRHRRSGRVLRSVCFERLTSQKYLKDVVSTCKDAGANTMKHLRVYFTSVIYEQSAGAKPKLLQLILRMYFYVFCIVCILQTNTFNLQAIFTSNFPRKVS